ncbi:DUF547 domain-containing protein [Roseivirga sp. BDSF3-8]|uniref:DUF547 domain-containing protein n=1 Tax=Roseivirga sp. BDSF3-8 TaxID=3241598 RepID=UPI0035320691
MLLVFSCSSANPEGNNTVAPGHGQFTQLLREYVDGEGLVNYQGLLSDSIRLNDYLLQLESAPPSPDWSREEKLAYWLNAYNAYTLQLILRNYPVKSIKDITKGPNIPYINSPWDIKFIRIGSEELDLNNIEHGIIRKEFDEPRIHFALVCAAMSCPPLRREAYTADELEEQLQDQAQVFLSNDSKNRLEGGTLYISKIFDWYKKDFKPEGVAGYIHQVMPEEADEDAEVAYLDYNWSLNEQK